MIYVFRPRHAVAFIFVSVTICSWVLGGDITSKPVDLLTWKGIKLTTTLILGFSGIVGIVWLLFQMVFSDYEKQIHIKLPSIKDSTFGPDDPRWDDFQEFLKEREENERT